MNNPINLINITRNSKGVIQSERQMRVGSLKMATFASFAHYIFRTFTYNFLTVLSEILEHANPLDVVPKTNFNAKWPFKPFNVICFGVTEEPLKGYIVHFTYCSSRSCM